MGFKDKVRTKAQQAAAKNPDKLQRGIDKAAQKVNEKTGGKYSEQINQRAKKAKGFAAQQGGGQGQQGQH